MEGFKKLPKYKAGGAVTNVYEAKKSSGDKDNIRKTKEIKPAKAAAPSKAAVKSKDFGGKTVGPSGHKDPYIKSKESGKTADFPSAAVKGRNKKATGTVNKFKCGGGVKKYSGEDGSYVTKAVDAVKSFGSDLKDKIIGTPEQNKKGQETLDKQAGEGSKLAKFLGGKSK